MRGKKKKNPTRAERASKEKRPSPLARAAGGPPDR